MILGDDVNVNNPEDVVVNVRNSINNPLYDVNRNLLIEDSV